MSVELLTSTDFYILDTNFRKILNLTQYESLMWVDKYDQPGSFEIYAPPTEEIKASAQIGNYFQSTKSEHLMVIEKLKTTFSPQNGERLVISGRSLESILDRRVVFTQTYFHTKQTSSDTGPDNLEDAVRQLLDATFIKPSNTSREVNNFVFEYTHDSSINTIDMEDMVFDKGENVLNIVNTIVKSKNLGYKITLNSSNQFVFKLIAGKDRSRDQNVLPLVEFSPTFNNLKESTFTVDAGENFKNYVFTEGEIYNSQKPLIIETGDATGLDRREIYIESSSTHENESSNLVWDTETQKWVFRKESKTLTDEEYEEVLKEEGDESFNSYSAKAEMESEVEPRLQFVYGRDFTIGDIVQIKDKSGNTSKSRVVEFIISHSASGYEEYPTFEDSEAESVIPSQTSSTGGEYSEKGKMTNDEIIREAGGFNPDLLNNSTVTPTDNDIIITKESSTWYKKAFSKIWDYIKAKLGINTSGDANKVLNEKGQFAVPPYATSAGSASTANHASVATRVCRDDAPTAQMVFHWDGRYSGNHAYLWGSTDAVNNWVYHTTQMHVAGASALDTLAFNIRYGSTITSSAAAGAEICACTLGYSSGKFLVFFSPRWSSVNVWYHLTDLATNSRICDVVGGSNASGFGVGFVDANSDRWFRVTCDVNLSNATIAIFIAVLRLS